MQHHAVPPDRRPQRRRARRLPAIVAAAAFSLVLAVQAASVDPAHAEKLDPAAHHYVKIDNTGDGVEDVAYRWP